MKPHLPTSLLKSLLLVTGVTTTVAAVTLSVYQSTTEEQQINFIDTNTYTFARDVERQTPRITRAVEENVLTVDDTAAIYVTSDGNTANGATEYRQIGKKNYSYSLLTNGSYYANAQWRTDTEKGLSFWYAGGNTTEVGSGGNGNNVYEDYAYNQNSTAATLERIILPEGKQLYIGGAAYKGTIEIQASATAGDKAVLGTYDTTAGTYQFATLTGAGDLLLLGNNTSGTAIFDFTDSSAYSGTVYMTANGGAVQVNAHGDGWQHTVFDFTRNEDFSDSEIDDTGAAPSSQTLLLTADARVVGLRSGSDDAHISTGAGNYTLTMGGDAEDYSYSGGVQNRSADTGLLSLTKLGANTQEFTQNAILNAVNVQGGSLVLSGGLEAASLELNGGVLQTDNGSYFDAAELHGGNSWTMGGANMVASSMTLYGMEGATVSFIGLVGTDATLNGPMSLNLSGSGATDSAAWFSLENLTLNFNNDFAINGIEIGENTTTLTLAQLGEGSSVTQEGAITVSAANGNTYTGTLRTEGGYAYIDLKPDVWPPLIETEQGFIWSGEANGTSPEEHRGMSLGNVWRADGVNTATGWHEQSVGKGAGVYANGYKVTFGDTNYHGDAVGAAGRWVDIQGKVAPGTILVTADVNTGLMSNNAEARLKYGYAFASTGSGSIVDGDGFATKIIKDGEALLVLSTTNTFSGGVEVNNGGLFLATVGAAGTGAISVHTDNKWTLDVWDNTTTSGAWSTDEEVTGRTGAEIMVCYRHSDDTASGFRAPTVTNDIVMVDNDSTQGGRLIISYGTSSFSQVGTDDHENVPRHWRHLTLSGALVGTGDARDVLQLSGYTSTLPAYGNQSYVSSFILNTKTATITDGTAFNGTVVLKNMINTSPLSSNLISTRTAGSVQITLQDNKLAHSHLDLTRESVEASDGTRQTYTNILLVNGDAALRGLSADFRGNAWKYTTTGGTARASVEFAAIAQDDEVWHVRTVTNSISTLTLGKADGSDSATYIYSGAMGYEQSYVEPTEAHIRWGDGFDAPPTGSGDAFIGDFNNGFHNAMALLSLTKLGSSNQYIHTAQLNDVEVHDGTLGFNSLTLRGNMSLVSGATLALGVTEEAGWENNTVDSADGFTSADAEAYRFVATSSQVNVLNGNKLTIYTEEPAALPGTEAYVPSAAVVNGDIKMNTGSGLFFEVSKVEPWFHEFEEGKSLDYYNKNGVTMPADTHGPSEHMLLDVNGTLNLMSNTADMEIRFRGVNFSLTPFSDRLYYLAEAENISVGDGGDSSEFASRLITLGYGYFGLVDTLDSSNAVHNTGGKDYLVMSVLGDPRHTWSGMVDWNGGNIVWDVPAEPSSLDYRWKENTAFANGHVVLFGNLYTPKGWNEYQTFTSDETVRVITTADSLQPGTLADSELVINSLPEATRFGTPYQKVEIRGEVAPLSIIIGSEYLDVTTPGTEVVTEDDTNYWFFGTGVIRDANEQELSDMFQAYEFDGGTWLTNLEKYGNGTAVIATANTYSGGTRLYGGKIVMQHVSALGSGRINIVNGATLQGDFADDRTAADWPEYDGAFIGEGMLTTTVRNVVDVRLNFDTEGNVVATTVDARIANAYDKKMVLTELHGDAGTVLVLHGSSAPALDHSSKYTYAVFKVLDPSDFYGTIRMDGNLWGEPTGTPGGKVQLEIMTTDKSTVAEGQVDDSQKKDWLNTNIDLSVTDGTERTVLALDAIEGSGYALTQEALVNSLNGTGTVRMADGAINSSVVNMSEQNHITLVIKGLSNGDYDGVLGYGEFQHTTDYGTEHREHFPVIGETCHHYGNGDFGGLNVRKEGVGTTQSVYNAWLAELEVQGGTFVVDHVLQVNSIIAGGGPRLFVGSVSDLNTVYALTVGKGGILSMDTQLFEADGSTKLDAWAGISAGSYNETTDGNVGVGWVQLQDGSTLTAHSDWFTDTQVEIENGSAVTINAHNYTPDPFITSDHEDHEDVTGDEGESAHIHFEHFNASHIIQLLGNLSGKEVNLTFTNEQMSPGANAQELGGSDYMGYVAIKDHNQMTGALLVKEQTVLQVLNSAGTQADMDVTVDGTDAAMQVVEAAQTQYVDSLTVRNGGALLLGGTEKTSLADGDSALKSIDYTQERVQLSVSNRFADKDGTMSTVHADLSGAAARIGGSSDLNSDASNVHITAHSAGNHEVHDTNLHSSLVELKAGTSMSLDDNVLIDKESVVFGSLGMVDMNAPQTLAVTDMQFASIDPQAATENVTVGTTTTLELTTSGGTIYRAGNTSIYHVTADQLHNVNVSGSGLTIQLMEDDFLYSAFAAGAGYVAIQISGLGQFLFEDNADAFTLNNWMLMDASGVDITSSWVTSSVVSADAGVDVSSHMLYIMVPEPATATLSLLALCALAARRRRRA